MTRDVLPPIAPLAHLVRHVMLGGFPAEDVCLPACADVQLLVYLEGGATLLGPDGTETALPPAFLVGAVTHPRRYRVAPGSRFVAVTFRPGGVYACLGMSAADLTGRFQALQLDGVLAGLDCGDEDAAAARMQSWLEDARAGAAPRRHLLPAFDLETLHQPVAELAAQLGIGVRQFERRCLDCFGMPLRAYRRLARYSAAMTTLMLEGASARALADLAQASNYVDQAHFTRDFSAMVGQSPKRFLGGRGALDIQLWQFTKDELETYLR